MKEFNSQTGGRYTYIDDIINLQELALAFGHLFDGCDNFIISGCEAVSGGLTGGYVWLNGKLRSVRGQQTVTLPVYLCENNKKELVPYTSGGQKVGRTNYGCTVRSSVPTTVDEVTGQIPASITIDASGKAMRLNDALFGKYALLKDPSAASQIVKGPVLFSGSIKTPRVVAERVDIEGTGAGGAVYHEGAKLKIRAYTGTSSSQTCELEGSPESGWIFKINGVARLSVSSAGCVSAVPLQSAKIVGGSLVMSTAGIYNATDGTDSGRVDINMIGYSGGTSKKRSLRIGDGAGSVKIEVKGDTGQVFVNAPLFVASPDEAGVVVKSSYLRSSSSFSKTILFSDSAGAKCASVGYAAAANSILKITNNIGDVELQGTSAVNIGPVIKEGGVKLSEKYVLKSDYNTAVGGKVDATDVYSKTAADSRFAAKGGGFTQFVTSSNTKTALCSQIGAATTDAVGKCVEKSKLLADMATTEALKQQIRQNIGAASVSDITAKDADTGWVDISEDSRLFVRAIGNVVCIQGKVKTHHTGVVFTLPNSIPAPGKDVVFSAAMGGGEYWSCYIEAGSKVCRVADCYQNDIHKSVRFTLTYMA